MRKVKEDSNFCSFCGEPIKKVDKMEENESYNLSETVIMKGLYNRVKSPLFVEIVYFFILCGII
ncbi:MAG: hypothetical protein JG776_2282 [Caloramator sp.]|nr:hypothetical protein [Caloramator sp.]